MRRFSRTLRLIAAFCLLSITLLGCAGTDRKETRNAPADPTEAQAYQIVEKLIGERQTYFISVLSCQENAIEAFAVYPYTDQEEESVNGIIEQIEVLHITRTAEEWEIADIQYGRIYKASFFDTDMPAQNRQDPDGETEMSVLEAQNIVAGLYESWADFRNRFDGEYITGAEKYPGEEYGKDGGGYVVCPKELFSSMEEIRTELEQILTAGCAEQFWKIWIAEREMPYYFEQNGVLYRMDIGSMGQFREADRYLLREYTDKEICAYVIEPEIEYEIYQQVYKMTIVNTEAGWRIRQFDMGYMDTSSELQ